MGCMKRNLSALAGKEGMNPAVNADDNSRVQGIE